MLRSGLAGVFVILMGVHTALAAGAGDPKKGQAVFLQCRACHSLDAGKNLVGPSLHGLFGRTAGTVPGYNYSPAMKKAGQTGLVWTEATLDKYITDPKAEVPGDKMPYPGLKDAAKRADLLAYLKEATQ